MAKVLPATCENEVVTVEGQTVEAEILSDGVGSSSGICVLDGESAYYVPNITPDLSTMIEDLVGLIDQVSTIATALDAVTVSPGSAAAAITQLGVLKTQFEATKDALR